jgi:hypothetical protein
MPLNNERPPFGLLPPSTGPYGPMGGGVNIGTPLDYNRPKIDNKDGSFSTERTITLPLNGRWYNVPTMANGQPLTPEETEFAFTQGWLPHVGEFSTVDEAIRSASARSKYIGDKRK